MLLATDVTQSQLEDRLLWLCTRHRLPRPQTQHRIGARTYDFAWPEQRVVVETDSWRAHGTPYAFQADRTSSNALQRRRRHDPGRAGVAQDCSAMTSKAAFNAEEWAVVSSAPSLAALKVIAAQRGGTVRESLAAQRAFADALAAEPGPLLREVLTTPTALDAESRPRTPDELQDQAPETLRRAIALLEERATDDEVVEYKRFVYGLAETVARAHKEGGFLGLGGTEISEAEQAALDEIAAIFDERQAR